MLTGIVSRDIPLAALDPQVAGRVRHAAVENIGFIARSAEADAPRALDFLRQAEMAPPWERPWWVVRGLYEAQRGGEAPWPNYGKEPYQVHHIIPRDDPAVRELQWMIYEARGDIDNRANLIAMPTGDDVSGIRPHFSTFRREYAIQVGIRLTAFQVNSPEFWEAVRQLGIDAQRGRGFW